MNAYFELQYQRIIRNLRGFGINPYLGIALAGLAFAGLSNQVFSRVSYPQYVYGLLTLVAVYPLGDARKNEFLQSIFTRDRYREIRLKENLLVAAPFIIFLLAKRQFLIALITLLGAAGLSFRNKVGRAVYHIPSPFSKRPFEFTTGFRKSYLLIIALYIITGISIYVHNFNLGIVALAILFLAAMNYYGMPEPPFYVWIYTLPPRAFLMDKLATAVRYGLALAILPALILAIGYPAKAWITALVLLIGCGYMLMGVVAKYASYPEQTQLPDALLMTLGILFPPALLVLIPYFFSRSVKKLNAILQ